MSIICYIIALMSLVFSISSLFGIATTPIYTGKYSYRFLDKINRDDPFRLIYISSNFFIYLFLAILAFSFGLYGSNIITEKTMNTIVPIIFLSIVLLILFCFIWCKKVQYKVKKEKSIFLDKLQIIYGITTPKIFDETDFQIAYDTLVQEHDVPFITCEIHRKSTNSYIGDLIFEKTEEQITPNKLRNMPIGEIHIDPRYGK